jgi:predicted metal-binding membrane protein
MFPARADQRVFIGILAVLFAASTALTITWCGTMSTMHGMPMPGGWNMSMMWMRMPGQSWAGSAAAFLGMWLAMMIAMMLLVLAPVLWRHARAISALNPARVGAPIALAGTAYFAVWTLFGAVVFLAGTVLAALEMQLPLLARAVPIASGAIVLIAGGAQFSAWKMHHLACCRTMPVCCEHMRADARAAWRHGLRLGVHCVHCCCGLTAVLLVSGVMDLRAMAFVSAAIAVERLAPVGAHAAKVVGVIVMAAGMLQVVRATLT